MSCRGCRRSSKEGEAERLATGFTFTEGPLYHPDGFYYFVDVRESKFYRHPPGQPGGAPAREYRRGQRHDLRPAGRLVICEGGNRRLTRWPADGKFGSCEVLIDRFEGKRLSRPNDLVCKSDGSIYFTNPGLRIPLAERELDPSAVYRVKPDGSASHVCDVEYPNGLAFSPDERTLYIANTRQAMYIHAVELDSAGNMVRRRIFADMSSDEEIGVPDGMKVDVEGRVYCTGRAAPGFSRRRREAGDHQDPGGPGQPVLWRARHEDPLLHRPHLDLLLRVKVPGLPGHPYRR